MHDTYVTDKEVSARTGIPVKTLASWRSRGEGPPFVKFGARTPRYGLAELDAWIAARAAGGGR